MTAKASADLVPHAHTASSTQWIDQASASFLQLATRRCQVTTTHPFALSALDAKELLDLIAPIVAQEFSELPIDPKATMGPDSISKGWLLGKAQSPERWGVFFSAYPDWGASVGSILFLASPTQKIMPAETRTQHHKKFHLENHCPPCLLQPVSTQGRTTDGRFTTSNLSSQRRQHL